MKNLQIKSIPCNYLIESFRAENDNEKPFEQITMIADSVFLLMDEQELPEHIKTILYQLHKTYEINKAIINRNMEKSMEESIDAEDLGELMLEAQKDKARRELEKQLDRYSSK